MNDECLMIKILKSISCTCTLSANERMNEMLIFFIEIEKPIKLIKKKQKKNKKQTNKQITYCNTQLSVFASLRPRRVIIHWKFGKGNSLI